MSIILILLAHFSQILYQLILCSVEKKTYLAANSDYLEAHIVAYLPIYSCVAKISKAAYGLFFHMDKNTLFVQQ